MCTVSLVALQGGGYLLAANRDEHASRGVARPPERATAGANAYVAPRDADAGGTWIAVDRAGRSLCLLNGDRPGATTTNHAGARSRGLLLLDLMRDPRPAAVVDAIAELHRTGRLNYRPFKLLAVEPRGGDARARLEEVDARSIEFDGSGLKVAPIVAPHVETSNGFDPQGVARARGAAFRVLVARLAALPPSGDSTARIREELLAWHRSHAAGEETGGRLSVCLHPHQEPQVRTVSSTLVDVRPDRIAMRYQPGRPCEDAPAVESTP